MELQETFQRLFGPSPTPNPESPLTLKARRCLQLRPHSGSPAAAAHRADIASPQYCPRTPELRNTPTGQEALYDQTPPGPRRPHRRQRQVLRRPRKLEVELELHLSAEETRELQSLWDAYCAPAESSRRPQLPTVALPARSKVQGTPHYHRRDPRQTKELRDRPRPPLRSSPARIPSSHRRHRRRPSPSPRRPNPQPSGPTSRRGRTPSPPSRLQRQNLRRPRHARPSPREEEPRDETRRPHPTRSFEASSNT